MRPVPSSRESPPRGPRHDYTDSAVTSQTLESDSCFLVTESEMDLELNTGSMLPRGRSAMKSEAVAQRDVAPSPMPSSPMVGSTADRAADLSAPNTPSMRGLSRPESFLSFISSPRNCSSSSSAIDHDGSIENAIITQQHIEAYRDLPPSSAGSPVPQFIMPNLKIPRRRPFTDVGRSLGKLRLLVLGSSGTGKTSIIRSISQCCEHIVHLDALNTNFNGPVLEIHASTRPYQWWQTGSSETLRRRRSSTSVEEILDRNLCFLDFTPQGPSSTPHAVDFLESTLSPLLEKQMADADLISLLSNGNEPIIDAVLYMLPSTGLTGEDAGALSRLQSVTNIIPLLARSDELDEATIEDCKQTIRDELDDRNIDVFSFSPLNESDEHTGIFAVSNTTQEDSDVMDASILMNSAYMEPLVPTDLRELVESMFSLEGASRLRHSAAVKAVKWAHEQHRYHPSNSALTRCTFNTGSTVTIDPFFQMKDWRRLEVSSWAQSLRHSLDSERIMTATASNQLIARATGTVARRPNRRDDSKKRRHVQHACDQDPLGLVRLAAQVKNTGAFAVELIGGIGVVGYLALYLMKPDFADRNVRLFAPSFFAI
ncbi:hypothetical protein NLG97_g7382 [Lecanicillium saksenae]|uniref:Uncharacterized protein n=1 Tax=Lecanicillium saksenae TaxID=468837 RepID=A0ACC1QM04_9HYPO|nr:hypothetical protein NLG97_g7382 [Lecanicillium saksenae]